MSMNNQGRPSATSPTSPSSGRGLNALAEGLIFEQGKAGRCGVDLEALPSDYKARIGGAPRASIGLPGLSEPQVARHFTRLSQKNFGIDSVFYPLGSCTMKHNPRVNEKLARLPGFSDLHPMQPIATVQGALEVIDLLAGYLKTLTGMGAVAMTPAAGAHGEMCALTIIKAAMTKRGEHRHKILVPESAHGTNPASAAALGFSVDTIPAGADGRVDINILREKMSGDVAALMLTNPSTCGLFENNILEIADIVHKAGGYFYCDGANFNALVGRVRPGDLGIDIMHLNLHKTFSTPHGGGGPGSGPVVMTESLAPFIPVPFVVHDKDGFHLIEDTNGAGKNSIGRIKGFHGQMGMFIRALAYILSHGNDGLRQVSSDAVLGANYISESLKDILHAPFPGPCMHEALFDDSTLKDTGVTTLDIAKGLIDRGFHPMTMYFPLVVHGAMLIEPTECESLETLDSFITALRDIMTIAKNGGGEALRTAPHQSPAARMDETRAARQPILRWRDDGR